MIDVVKGVEVLHDRDVAHTDIVIGQFVVNCDSTPDSVPLVQIQDFNRARFQQRLNDGSGEESADEVPMKCPFKVQGAGGRYRSPEEYRHLWLNEKVDVFSLGYILYEVREGEERRRQHDYDIASGENRPCGRILVQD
jgi:serine/threonine protein kinase